MRYKFIPAVLVLLTSSLAFAQKNDYDRKLRFGVFGGRHILGETFTYEKIKAVSGPIFGLDFSYNFRSNKSGLSIHIQPNWTSYYRNNKEPATSDDYKTQALNVPLLARYSFGTGKIRPFIEGGLNIRSRKSFQFERNGRICIYMSPCANGKQTIDLHPELTDDKAGLIAGLGVEFDVWQLTIPVTVRLNEGIGTYEMKERMEDSYYFDKIKTRNIQVTAGITF